MSAKFDHLINSFFVGSRLDGTNVYVVREEDDQVELSFVRTWNSSDSGLPLNIDKRCIVSLIHHDQFILIIKKHLFIDLPKSKIIKICNASRLLWILLVCNSGAVGRVA